MVTMVQAGHSREGNQALVLLVCGRKTLTREKRERQGNEIWGGSQKTRMFFYVDMVNVSGEFNRELFSPLYHAF
ncbi:MAG: hypothetical protein AMK70_11865 [Nitrospira bacterium SG8_35_1]|nr:MAG: hypothetical protein AMK70_11865 [Nitrospira bacterium SG8_35_1]